jgi:glycosyltransferase involved in cell wall biosynthesis
VVHEWLSARAGSEQVFEALAGLFPEADLYALTREPGVPYELGGRPVRTTWLDRPRLRDARSLTLPLMPLAWRTLRPDRYDVVLSSSHAAAKGFWPGREALHLCYCHTPMRYAWSPDLDARGASPLLAPARRVLRGWDRRSAAWVDSFAANSTVVADRIALFYDRPARVIPPPVEIGRFDVGRGPRRGAIAFSRWIPYKRLDIAIEACLLTGTPLVVAGSGPDEARLRSIAGSSSLITFERRPDDDHLARLLAGAELMIFPAEEDFGIVPVEAMAAGTPVLAYAEGGAADTVVPHSTGLLVAQQSAGAFAEGIDAMRSRSWDADTCRRRADAFAPAHFAERITTWVEEEMAQRGLGTLVETAAAR